MFARHLSPRYILYSASVLLLGASVVMLYLYGGLAYYLTFHRPLGFSLPKAYHAPAQPGFEVVSHIDSTALFAGETQHIHLAVTPRANAAGYIEVWVESPANKQVFQSDTSGSAVQFKADIAMSQDYRFTVASTWPKGVYKVGEIITSPDQETDYYVRNDMQEFSVQ
jgi:hypothetical protein